MCIILMLVLTILSYMYFQIPFSNILKAMMGSLVFIGMVSYIDISIIDTKIGRRLQKNGFGIYLFHPMIIYILYFYLGSVNLSPLALCFGIATVSYVLSSIFTEVFRKLHLTLLVGE